MPQQRCSRSARVGCEHRAQRVAYYESAWLTAATRCLIRLARALVQALVQHSALRLGRLVQDDRVLPHFGRRNLRGLESLVTLPLRFRVDVVLDTLGGPLRLVGASEEQDGDRRFVRSFGVGEGAHSPVLVTCLVGEPISDRSLLA